MHPKTEMIYNASHFFFYGENVMISCSERDYVILCHFLMEICLFLLMK